MKQTFKRIGLFLAVLLLLQSLFACRTEPDPEEPDETISTEALAGYTVIYPTKATQTLKDAVGKLTAKVKEVYGVSLSVKEDFYREGVAGTEILPNEILIGSTNREESAALTGGFRANDYGYRILNGKLAIAGICEETDATAVEHFIEHVFVAKEGTTFFSNRKNGYSFLDRYDLDDLKIGDVDVSAFRIVIPADAGTAEHTAAELLRNAVADKCGVLLTVVNDSFAAQEHEIRIGHTNRASQSLSQSYKYCYEEVNGNICLYGGSSTAVYYGAKALAQKIGDLSSPVFELSRTVESYPEEELTIMSWNLCQQHTFTKARMDSFLKTINAQHPDVVFFEEARLTETERNTFLTGMGSSYANAVTKKSGEPSVYYNSLNKEMFYNKDVLNLLWSDYFWLSETPDQPSTFRYASEGTRDTTVACFERKTDGKQFIVITFHPEWTTTVLMQEHGMTDKSMRAQQFNLVEGRIAGYKEKNPEAAVIFGGDFNAKRGDSSETLFGILKSDGFVDAGTTAFDIKDGETFPGYGTVIDFIFGERDRITFTSYEAIQLGAYVNAQTNPGTNPSDHNPIVVKMLFNE